MKRAITPATLFMITLLGGALLVGGYIVKRLLAKEDVAPTVNERLIPVALSDLKPGTVIQESHLGQRRVADAMIAPNILLSNRSVIGRVVKNTVKAAQPIDSEDLYEFGVRPPLEVSPDMRAVTVALTDATAAVDGNLQDGQFVDVHFTPNVNEGDERFRMGFTMKLLEGVKILKIGASGSRNTRNAATATLEVSPDQANVLILARGKGTMTLVFNPDGKGRGGIAVSSADRAYLEEILGLQPVKKPDPPFVTEHFNGSADFGVLGFRDGKRVDVENRANLMGGAANNLNSRPNPNGGLNYRTLSYPQNGNGNNQNLNNQNNPSTNPPAEAGLPGGGFENNGFRAGGFQTGIPSANAISGGAY